jgi:PKD repeat protein
MKKTLLTTAAFALLSAGVMAQGQKNKAPIKKAYATTSQTSRNITVQENAATPVPNRGCGTAVPTKEWDEAFNKMVEAHKADMATGRATATTYTIPIIFHIISSTGEAVNSASATSGHNLNAAQIQSQITILNNDYNGTGYNTNIYATYTNTGGTPAFYDYAHANTTGTNSVSPSSLNSGGGIAIGVSGIYWCLATKNPSGTTLAEPGIDRVTWESCSGAVDPATGTQTTFNTNMDTKIKPATIWDPTKYFNVWVSDGGTAGLLGYATFPPVSASSTSAISSSQNAGTTTGSFGETNSGTPSQTDGVWVAYTAVGNTGTVQSPYQYGRSLTHESGHWLGLRHIWGDGTCANDFCNDTPPAAAANINLTAFPNPRYPYHKGTCTTAPTNSTDGEMYMNFMDYSGDAELWMFTNEQVNRFHASLASSPYRSGLTASAANLCTGVTVTTPTAAFTYPTTLCLGVAEQFTDASTGPPSTWSWSVTPSASVTIASATSQDPMITFPSAGSYTVTLAATNTVGTNSTSHVVTVTSCALTKCDTLTNFSTSDTLTIFPLGMPVQDSGYISGTNIYGDLAKAEFYNSTTLANTQISGVVCLFFKDGTRGTGGTGTVSLNILSGDNTNGPTGTAIGTATANLATIAATTATTGVKYCGNPNIGFSTALIVPYKFTFATPVPTPTATGGFFASLNIPAATGGDTLVLFQNTNFSPNTVATAWELNAPSPGTWASAKTDWGFGDGVSFAILPVVCPTGTTGIQSNELASGVNLFPNPNNGQFNFAVTLSEATNLNFTIINMLGQVVYTKSENNITNAVLSCNLSHLEKGVYYASITDSNNNKTVKKIIIE